MALGDSVIGLRGDSLACRRMAEAFVRRRADVVIAVREVPRDHVRFYGIVVSDGDGDTFRIRTLVEKPSPQNAPSRLAVAGRYAFSPRIFGLIREVRPDRRGEIQLTDAIRAVAEQGGTVLGVRLGADEKRYDIGNMPSYFETFLDFAAADPDHGPRVRSHMRRILRRYSNEEGR